MQPTSTSQETPPQRVEAHRVERVPGAPRTLEEDLAAAATLSRWLDTRFSIAGVKFGMDALIGLIPGVGDTATTLIGLYPLLIARRHGLGKLVAGRMIGNLAIDWVVGLVPLLGDVFDIAFKAHRKNFALLQRAAEKHASRRS